MIIDEEHKSKDTANEYISNIEPEFILRISATPITNVKTEEITEDEVIATGCDCPRAKILVKLHEGGSEKFNIQTIGRIRRMPQRHHYENEILDNCYLYTLDNQFTEGLTNGVNASFYTYLYKRKNNAPNILLKKEFINANDTYAINHEEVVKVIKKQFLKECDINHNGILEKSEMEINKCL